MQPHESEFENLLQKNRMFRTSYWHRLNLDALAVSRSKGILTPEDKINRVDMITPVLKRNRSLQAQLSFSTFGWLQAEKVAASDINLQQLNFKRRLVLSLGIFPQANTLLHLIAEKSSKEDQSFPAMQIQALLDAEQFHIDPDITGTEEEDQFKVPILVNQIGKSAYQLMHDSGRRVLIDTLMGKVEFHRIINYQEEIDELLQQEDPNMMKFIESSLQQNKST